LGNSELSSQTAFGGVDLNFAQTDFHVGPGSSEIAVAALVYLIYALWAFLLVRDVVRTRRAGYPLGWGWNLIPFLPFGVLVWVVYRRFLLHRPVPVEEQESDAN